MRLLQTEIDVVPGREPDRAARNEGLVGVNSAYLEIKNSTGRVNSYTVRVACDHPYWQAAWYSLVAMPPGEGQQNQPPKGKPDQPGAKGQSFRVHINNEGSRKLRLELKMDPRSEARAGAYPIRVVVESVITDASTPAGPARITELPATVIIRPFYDWEVSFQPSDKAVGTLRRKAHMEIVVTNKGNDWLYLQFNRGPSQVMNLEAPVVRLAVPPPEPGQTFERSVPLTAITKLRTIRGDKKADNVPLACVRVDAPSVPALPEDVRVCKAANLGQSVVPSVTNETRPPATPGTLTYCPPIPATLAGFLAAVLRNGKALAMIVVGAILMFMGFAYLYEKLTHTISNVTLQGLQEGQPPVWDGQTDLELQGNLLKPGIIDFTFTDDATHQQTKYTVENLPDTAYKGEDKPWYTMMDWGAHAPRYSVELKDLIHHYIGNAHGLINPLTVTRRFLFLGTVGMSAMPARNIPNGFRVGPPPVPTDHLDANPASPVLNPGDNIKLTGNLGKRLDGATVTVDGNPSRFLSRTETSATIAVPDRVANPDQFNVTISVNGTTIWTGQFSIKAPGAGGAPAAPGGSTPGNSPGGSTPGGGPAVAPGGGAPGGGVPSDGGGAPAAPPPAGAAKLLGMLSGGAPSKDAVGTLPHATPADHAVRAIGFYLARDATDGDAESQIAENGTDYKAQMNALLNAVYIAQEMQKDSPSASTIAKNATSIRTELGDNSPLKLPFRVAAMAFDALGDKTNAATYRKLGGG